jgi:hypothetical protein
MAKKLAVLVACSIAFGVPAAHAAPLSDARIKEVLSTTSNDAVRIESLRSRDRNILSLLGEALSLKYGLILEGSEMLFTRIVSGSVIYYRLDFVGLKNKEYARALCDALEIDPCISIGKTGEMMVLKADGDETVSVLGVLDEDAPIVLLAPQPPKSYNPHARSIEASVREMTDPLGAFPIPRPVLTSYILSAEAVSVALIVQQSNSTTVAESLPKVSQPTPIAHPFATASALHPVVHSVQRPGGAKPLPLFELDLESATARSARIEVFEYFDSAIQNYGKNTEQNDILVEEVSIAADEFKNLNSSFKAVTPETDFADDYVLERIDINEDLAPFVMDVAPAILTPENVVVRPVVEQIPHETSAPDATSSSLDANPAPGDIEVITSSQYGLIQEDASVAPSEGFLFNDESRFGDFFTGEGFVDIADISGLMGTASFSDDALILRLPGLGRVDFSDLSTQEPSIKSSGSTQIKRSSDRSIPTPEVAVVSTPAEPVTSPIAAVEPAMSTLVYNSALETNFAVVSTEGDVVQMPTPLQMDAPSVETSPVSVLPRGPIIDFDLAEMETPSPVIDEVSVLVALIDSPVNRMAIVSPKLDRPVLAAPKKRTIAFADLSLYLAQKAVENANILRLASIKPHDAEIVPLARSDRFIALAEWTSAQSRIAVMEEKRIAEQVRLAEIENLRIAEEVRLAQIEADRIAGEERVAALKVEADLVEQARIAAIIWHDVAITPLPRTQRFAALDALQAQDLLIAQAEIEENQRIADAAVAERALEQAKMERDAQELQERQMAEARIKAAQDLREAQARKVDESRIAMAAQADAEKRAVEMRLARAAAPMIVADIRTPGSTYRSDFTVAMVDDLIKNAEPQPDIVGPDTGSTPKSELLGSVSFNDTYAITASVDFAGGSQTGRLQKMPITRPDLSAFLSRISNNFERVSSSDSFDNVDSLVLDVANGRVPRSDFAQVPSLPGKNIVSQEEEGAFSVLSEPIDSQTDPTSEISPLDLLLAAPSSTDSGDAPYDNNIFDVFGTLISNEDPANQLDIQTDPDTDLANTLPLDQSISVTGEQAQSPRPQLAAPVAQARPTLQVQAPASTEAEPQTSVLQAERDRQTAIDVLNEIVRDSGRSGVLDGLISDQTDEDQSLHATPVQEPTAQQPQPQVQSQSVQESYAIDERDPLPGYSAEREVAPVYVTPAQRLDQDRAAAIARNEQVQQQQNTGYNKADLRIELGYVSSREEVLGRVEELRGFFPPVMLLKGRFFGAGLPGVPGRFIVGIEAIDLEARDDLVWYMEKMSMPWMIRR